MLLLGPPLEISGTKKYIDSKRKSVESHNLYQLQRDLDHQGASKLRSIHRKIKGNKSNRALLHDEQRNREKGINNDLAAAQLATLPFRKDQLIVAMVGGDYYTAKDSNYQQQRAAEMQDQQVQHYQLQSLENGSNPSSNENIMQSHSLAYQAANGVTFHTGQSIKLDTAVQQLNEESELP